MVSAAVGPLSLADVAADHPCLWGHLDVLPSSPLVIEQDARLLPTRRTGQGEHWWFSRKQGALDPVSYTHLTLPTNREV